jgi:hypothetical protein
MIQKIWKDPVWSKVIAAAIIAIFAFLYTYFTDSWSNIFLFSVQIYTCLLEPTLVTNWLLTLLSILSTLFSLGLLLKLKNKLFNFDLKLINNAEEQMLITMAENGNNQYQIPFFVTALKINKAMAQLYAGHLADLGLIECDIRSNFPHYSMSVEGRNYLMTNGLI